MGGWMSRCYMQEKIGKATYSSARPPFSLPLLLLLLLLPFFYLTCWKKTQVNPYEGIFWARAANHPAYRPATPSLRRTVDTPATRLG